MENAFDVLKSAELVELAEVLVLPDHSGTTRRRRPHVLQASVHKRSVGSVLQSC